ncbi:tetratricopeptide repeat protein [Leptospira gomenensis]|uniref:Tetratricopeptide repeat protein n=1 Tax=Leptospira gomenensis TaxID=2484974 RepID=A0A5F1Z300_9LEPT|nr:tetratricopeptide repeat protein [Leptospira gomenensis]TGK29034.1 tetratricopeptide repeat protein [Leptospira gomenensis]TGK45001.1 tetratricopeptide repeat protein [Leptospira gomenensis]TGK51863.1 tetratricopeptide repeat protein [Leptospira gomenensis]TGK67329.1 tetratricopeptide repeat protein [Leptospira gomenensis]
MENKILGWFLFLGFAIFISGFFVSKPASESDNSASPSLISGFVSFLGELKTSMESSQSSSVSTTNQEDSREIFSRAYQAYEKGDYQEAIETYSRYIDAVSNDPAAHYNRALAYYNSSRYQEALTDLDRAIELDPNNVDYYFYKAYSLEYLDDCAEAIAAFQKYLEQKDGDVSFYGHKARCENQEKNFEQGLKDALKAQALDKNDAYSLFEIAFAQYALGRYSDSADSYTKLLKIQPKNQIALRNRGLSLIMTKKTAAACRDFRKSAQLGYEEAKESIKEYCN